MNYLDKIAAEIQRAADPDALPPDEDLPLYRLYAVLLLAKGKDVTAEDVHNAWAAWASDHEPESRDLLPFKEFLSGTSVKISLMSTPFTVSLTDFGPASRQRDEEVYVALNEGNLHQL